MCSSAIDVRHPFYFYRMQAGINAVPPPRRQEWTDLSNCLARCMLALRLVPKALRAGGDSNEFAPFIYFKRDGGTNTAVVAGLAVAGRCAPAGRAPARLGVAWQNAELALGVRNLGNARPNLGDIGYVGYQRYVPGTTTPVPQVATLPPRTFSLQYSSAF